MTFPIVTAATAGLLILLQILLAITVSMSRGDTGIGDGGKEDLNRAVRRHGNLAENSGIFIAGFMLLELSNRAPALLFWLCLAFLIVRLVHVFGLSMTNTMNPFRMVGGLGTYVVGLILGCTLLWFSLPMLLGGHIGS